MVIQLLIALLSAFLAVRLIGKRVIPWLERHNIRQYSKVEVEQKIYSPNVNAPTDGGGSMNDEKDKLEHEDY